jgi:hypothetical protein
LPLPLLLLLALL